MAPAPEAPADLEAGEGQWAAWAKAAARVRQQAAEAAEEARKGLVQASEKAMSAEWGDQARGWQNEVARGFGRVAEGATQATSVLSEKGKVAQQLAKDLQGKSQEKLNVAKAMSTKAALSAAGAAKGALSTAGQGISGLTALTLSPVKLAQFAGVFFLGIFLISLSFSFLPMLLISPQKFALLFALGSMSMLGSFAVLKGPQAFFRGLLHRDKLPFSILYAVGLVGTLVGTIIMRSYVLTAGFGLLQAVALLYFLAAHVPGGKAALGFCSRLGSRAARAVLCRAVR